MDQAKRLKELEKEAELRSQLEGDEANAEAEEERKNRWEEVIRFRAA